MEANRVQSKPLPAQEPGSAPQTRPADRKHADLTNKHLEISRFRSEKQGDIVMIYLSDVVTGDVEGIRWDEASDILQQVARRLASDPLGLLHILDAVVPGDRNTPSPCATGAQTRPSDEPYFSESTQLCA